MGFPDFFFSFWRDGIWQHPPFLLFPQLLAEQTFVTGLPGGSGGLLSREFAAFGRTVLEDVDGICLSRFQPYMYTW